MGESKIFAFSPGEVNGSLALFQVIHLVRDPRAVLHSMLRLWVEFGAVIDGFDNFCRVVEEDLGLEQDLEHTGRYNIGADNQLNISWKGRTLNREMKDQGDIYLMYQ